VDFLAIVPSPPQLIFPLYRFSTGERARVRGKESTVFWFIILYSTRLGIRLSILVPGLQPWNALHWRLLPPATISRGRSLGTRTSVWTA